MFTLKLKIQMNQNYSQIVLRRQQSMPRRKGSPNKVTSEVKDQLQNLIDEVVNSIDVNSMDTNQKLKLLQLSLHYVIPKLRSTETSDKPYEDLPLFIG